jgi:hypothetical protein
MKMLKISILILVVLNNELAGQENQINLQNPSRRNISIYKSEGTSSITDKQMSENIYSGTTGSIGIKYQRMYQTYGSYFKFNYENGSQIEYKNTSAATKNVLLSYGKIYSIKGLKLFDKNLNAWLGPSTDIYFHVRTQNTSLNIESPTVSYVLLFSVSINSMVVYPVNKKMACEGNFSATAISFGSRFPNLMYKQINLFKLLPFYKALINSDRIALAYSPFNFLTLKAGYEFDYMGIKSHGNSSDGIDWAGLKSISNRGFVEISFILNKR